MKKLSVAILLGLGMTVATTSMAAEVSMRMMEKNATAMENITKDIELPEFASENGVEHSAKGLANANERRAANRARKLERDDAKEDADKDVNDNANTDNRPENPGDSRVTPEMPELPETAELPELPEAADNRADRSNRNK